MKKALIISGGDYCSHKNTAEYDLVIACDKGLEYAQFTGIKPDLALGDFDSFTGNIPDSIKTIKLPCEKDDTDTMYAVKYALEKGFTDITISCAFGGRLDHTIANLQTLNYIVEKGGKAKALGKSDEASLIFNEEKSFEYKEGCSFSVYSLNDKAEGVSIKNAKYTVENVTITNSFPIGTSNEWLKNKSPITVSVKNGKILVVISKI